MARRGEDVISCFRTVVCGTQNIITISRTNLLKFSVCHSPRDRHKCFIEASNPPYCQTDVGGSFFNTLQGYCCFLVDKGRVECML